MLFNGIDVGAVTTSMTINSTAPILFAMYLAAADERRDPVPEARWDAPERHPQGVGIAQRSSSGNRSGRRCVSSRTLSSSARATGAQLESRLDQAGYHIREAGSTAAQELAFTLADGFAYVDAGDRARAGRRASLLPRLSFFFNAHIDFFEEIAKYRAARRIWARHMRDRYGAKEDERSLKLRFHTQTAGCSLTAQQIENNVARTAFEALAAVLGGTNSLHTNSMDEVLALPTEKAAQIALRTQQILAYETGVPSRWWTHSRDRGSSRTSPTRSRPRPRRSSPGSRNSAATAR